MPPNRPFTCKRCGESIQLNSDRGLLAMFGPFILVMLIVWQFELRAPWVLVGIPIALAAYVLFAKAERV
jgi:hypothetical protein